MYYIVVFILGLVVGSFVNVVAYRVPLGKSISKGRSKCPKCNIQIAWYDLVPVLSFFLLSARCRNCRAKISWLYSLGEFLSGLIFLLSFYSFQSYGLVYWLFTAFILEILLTLFLTDFQYLILPDIIILIGVIGAVVYGIFEKIGFIKNNYNILSIDNLVSAVSFSSILYLLWLGSKGKWIGLGDAKLAGLIGLLFGYIVGLSILYVAVIIGGIVGLTLLIIFKANRKTKLPLGSFISLSAAGYIFTGFEIFEKLRFDVIFKILQ